MKQFNNSITVSAPGKLMLFGEHAVVYGRPCIVIAVDQRIRAKVELLDTPVFQLDAPDVKVTNYKKPMADLGNGEIPKGAKFVEMAIKKFFNRHPERSRTIRHRAHGQGVKVTTASEFSSKFGFGSSSAATVCTIYALTELTGAKLDKKDIFDLSYKTVLNVQKKGSGFDVAAAIYGGTLYFVTGGKKIISLPVNHLPIIIGYSGIKFDTVRLINQVAEKAKKYPKLIDNIYSSIGKLVEQARQAILKSDYVYLGKLMNINEGYLAALGVEGKKLADMIYAARKAGAYGAKLSGAGMGDCMVAVTPKHKTQAVKNGITSAGGEVIDVKTQAEGIRIEPD
ncbi:mevalonate kinase [Candidatus Daviesbacteria bacterium]|nr:mevalonate kinase [Candidatus Daviesbacteria bacterium]